MPNDGLETHEIQLHLKEINTHSLFTEPNIHPSIHLFTFFFDGCKKNQKFKNESREKRFVWRMRTWRNDRWCCTAANWQSQTCALEWCGFLCFFTFNQLLKNLLNVCSYRLDFQIKESDHPKYWFLRSASMDYFKKHLSKMTIFWTKILPPNPFRGGFHCRTTK